MFSVREKGAWLGAWMEGSMRDSGRDMRRSVLYVRVFLCISITALHMLCVHILNYLPR